MTMQHPPHPDDERLAALAGDDQEVASDAALRAHVDSCDRCTEIVRDLGSLRSAMAELPDLVPSRPLRLLPPMPEATSPTRGGWLRRLAGPAMAAGFVLVAVGAIGSSGFSLGMASSGAAPLSENGSESTSGGNLYPAAAPSGSSRALSGQSAAASAGTDFNGATSGSPKSQRDAPPADSSGSGELFVTTDPRLPWLVVLGFGVGLLFAGIYLRFAQQPRAG